MTVQQRQRTPLQRRAPAGAARLPSASADLTVPAEHPLLTLQQSVGNRAVQRLLHDGAVIRRRHRRGDDLPLLLDSSGPTGSATAALQRDGTKADAKPAGPKAQMKQIGKVKRLRLEGLKVGNQDAAMDAADFMTGDATTESAKGMAIVLIPDGIDLKHVEVLLHLHGHGLGYRARKGQSQARDETIDQTESQLEASGRNMIAVLPQGTGRSGFGPGFDANTYLAAIFARLKDEGFLPKETQPESVVFSGHSGGGDIISGMLAEENEQYDQAKKKKRAEKGPSRMPDNGRLSELVLFDGLNTDGERDTLIRWLKTQLDHDLAELTNAERSHYPAAHRAYLAKSLRFRGYHSGIAGYARRYGRVDEDGKNTDAGSVRAALDQWFATHATVLGGPGEIAYDGLRANYQVIDTKRAGTKAGHERMMGENRLFEDALAPPKTPALVQPRRLAAIVQRDGPPKFKKQTYTMGTVPKVLATAGKKKDKVEIKESPADSTAAILEKVGINDPATWYGSFTDVTFLGRSLQAPIHTDLAAHLWQVEQDFIAKAKADAAKDPTKDASKITAASVGDDLGLEKGGIISSRDHATSASISMHFFGLALDLNYTANPFISPEWTGDRKKHPDREPAEKKNQRQVFERAGLLVENRAAHYTTGLDYTKIAAVDTVLTTYFSYIDDAKALEARLALATDDFWKGKTAAQATTQITADLDQVAKDWERNDATGSKAGKAIIKAGGFMDLKEELVSGMKLSWGGVYGDMMHFDMRNKGKGAAIYTAIGQHKEDKQTEAQTTYAKQQADKAAAAAKAKAAGGP